MRFLQGGMPLHERLHFLPLPGALQNAYIPRKGALPLQLEAGGGAWIWSTPLPALQTVTSPPPSSPLPLSLFRKKIPSGKHFGGGRRQGRHDILYLANNIDIIYYNSREGVEGPRMGEEVDGGKTAQTRSPLCSSRWRWSLHAAREAPPPPATLHTELFPTTFFLQAVPAATILRDRELCWHGMPFPGLSIPMPALLSFPEHACLPAMLPALPCIPVELSFK